MKRILSHWAVALAAGLALRLIFVLKLAAKSGDTILYDQIATNWLKFHSYAMDVGGVITPVDIRMPGYPAVLAVVYAMVGKGGVAAHAPVLLLQVGVDLLSCVAIARLAAALAPRGDERERGRRYTTALWLAALCPFTANYTATGLTEIFAIFFTALTLVFFAKQLSAMSEPGIGGEQRGPRGNRWILFAGLAAGCGTLFRPETPLVLVAGLMAVGMACWKGRHGWRLVRLAAVAGVACLLPLAPWALRNAITLHEFQVLAPKNSNLPGELVPLGFMRWEKTWLFKMSDCYRVSWKLNDEAIRVEDIPKRAFDNEEEEQRVAAILEPYNEELTLTAEEDAGFGQLGRERTARRPLRTYLWLPAARAMTLWFTPRIELLPVSGDVFPIRQAHEDDPVDQLVTVGLFVLNLAYLLLAIAGARAAWRRGQSVWAVVLTRRIHCSAHSIFDYAGNP